MAAFPRTPALAACARRPCLVHAQLAAFAAGTRRNDLGAQMRNVDRGMTTAEIEAASEFFAAHP